MVCVVSADTGARWCGLNVKMQTWGIQELPLFCAVRSYNLTVCLSVCWGGEGGRGGLVMSGGDRNRGQTSGCVALCLFVKLYAHLSPFTMWLDVCGPHTAFCLDCVDFCTLIKWSVRLSFTLLADFSCLYGISLPDRGFTK